MATRRAEIELTADDKKMRAGLNSATKHFSRFKKAVTKNDWALPEFKPARGSRFKGAAGALGGALGSAALGAGAAAAAGFGVAAKDALDFDRELTRLDISSQGALGSMDKLRTKVLAVSKATGVSKEDLTAGASAFVAITGDGKAAAASLETFAKIQKATGSSMQDIAGSAAALKQNMGIDPSQFEQAFSILIKGGKQGAIELRDMAGLLAGLSPLAERFAGGGGTTGLAELGAALQLTRQGFGSADEAATGLESLMGAIVQHADKLEKAGVKVFTKDAKTGKKELRGLREIVEAIGASKLAKDPTALTKALGRKEALAALIQLTKVDGAWEKLAGSTIKATDVADDYARVSASASARADKAWNNLKVTVAEAFTPERVQAFTDALGAALAIAGKLIGAIESIGEFMGTATAAVADYLAPTETAKTEAVKEINTGYSDKQLQARLDQAKAMMAGHGIGSGLYKQQAEEAERELRRRRIQREKKAAYDADFRASVSPSTYPEQAFDTEREMRERAAAVSPLADPRGGHVRVSVDAAPGLSVKIEDDPKQLVRAP